MDKDTINLLNGKALIEKKFKYGNNSTCLLVRYNDRNYVLKLMSNNSDINVNFDFMPKIVELGKSVYDNEIVDYRLYEYLDGELLLDKNTLSLDEIIDLIHIPLDLINQGYAFKDINASNFIFKKGKAYLVDYGSISSIECLFNGKFDNLIYSSNDGHYCYELRQNYVKPLDENITIWCFGKMIKECTNLSLNKNVKDIIDKMSSYFRNRRYKCFLDVYNDFIKLKEIE